MFRWLVLLVVVVTPAALIRVAVEAAVEPLGRRAGAGLATVALQAGLTRPPRYEPPQVVLVGPDFDSVAESRPRPAPTRRPSRPISAARNGPTSASSGRSPGIRVPAGAVLRLAEMGARPVGIPVPANGDRPAGISLHGVSGLGIGLQEGDLLVRAAGQPALDPGAVISAIIASRGARVAAISGEIWRSGRRFPLVVEQPYLPKSDPSPQGSASANGECGDGGPGSLACDAGTAASNRTRSQSSAR